MAGAPGLLAAATAAIGTIHLICSPALENGAPLNPPITFVIAFLLQEEVEAVRIGRLAIGGGKSSQVFPVGGSPAAGATLTPGSPFSGSATYTPGSGGTGTPGGDLSVTMPGAGAVPLGGPGFEAELLLPQA